MLDPEKLDRIYSLGEITLIPKAKTYIKSRSEVNPFDENGKLPLFVAPMTCILDVDNYDIFNQKSYAILPVYADGSYLINALELSNGWFALTLDTFRTLTYSTENTDYGNYFICIDTANGHMDELYDIVPAFKSKYPNSKVMIGNIANSNAYPYCCEAGIDYVRVGIGGGNGCTTSVLTGEHNGIVNMLSEIQLLKLSRSTTGAGEKFMTKVVADGGIDTIDKAIKCIALGADYVMAGKMFAMCQESRGKKCYVRKEIDGFGEPYYDLFTNYDMTDADYRARCDIENIPYNRYRRAVEYYGQSSIEGQLDRFGKVKSEPEGCKVYLPVRYTYDRLCEQFEAALRSAMSYNDSWNLDTFRGYAQIKLQSIAEFNLYYK